MDVDDCSEEQKNAFKNQRMFNDHWLKEYIVCIYNEPNLEQTMEDIGIKVERKKDYSKIFPINRSGIIGKKEIEDFLAILKKSRNSNMDKYVEYCLSII